MIGINKIFNLYLYCDSISQLLLPSENTVVIKLEASDLTRINNTIRGSTAAELVPFYCVLGIGKLLSIYYYNISY